MKRAALLLGATIFYASNTFAQEDNNKTISAVGVQGTNYYFQVDNGFSLNCIYGTMYFSNESGFGKGAYATLLTAKAQSKPITRIAYSQNTTTNVCTLELIQF
jgi:hypothetical protein